MCAPGDSKSPWVGLGEARAAMVPFIILRERKVEWETPFFFPPLFGVCFVTEIFFEKYDWLKLFFPRNLQGKKEKSQSRVRATV